MEYEREHHWFKVVCRRNDMARVQDALADIEEAIEATIDIEDIVHADGSLRVTCDHPLIEGPRPHLAPRSSEHASRRPDDHRFPVELDVCPVREIWDGIAREPAVDNLRKLVGRAEMEDIVAASGPGVRIKYDLNGKDVYVGGPSDEAVRGVMKKLDTILQCFVRSSSVLTITHRMHSQLTHSHAQKLPWPQPAHILYPEGESKYTVDARYMEQINPVLVRSTLFDPTQHMVPDVYRESVYFGASLRICLWDMSKRLFFSTLGPRASSAFSESQRRAWFKPFVNYTYPVKARCAADVTQEQTEIQPEQDKQATTVEESAGGVWEWLATLGDEKPDMLGGGRIVSDDPDGIGSVGPASLDAPVPLSSPPGGDGGGARVLPTAGSRPAMASPISERDRLPAQLESVTAKLQTMDTNSLPAAIAASADKHQRQNKGQSGSLRQDSCLVGLPSSSELDRPLDLSTHLPVPPSTKVGHPPQTPLHQGKVLSGFPSPGRPPAISFDMEPMKPQKKEQMQPAATLATGDEEDIHRFHSTTEQKPEKPDKKHGAASLTRAPRDPQDDFVNLFTAALSARLERLRVNIGKISLRVDFGRICLANFFATGLAFNSALDPANGWDPWELMHRLDRECNREPGVRFTKVLSPVGNDADYLIFLKEDDGKNRMWTPVKKSVVYEFHCYKGVFRSIDGRYVRAGTEKFIVDVDGTEPDNFTYRIRREDGVYEPIFVHCLQRQWDFQVSLSSERNKDELVYGAFARALVASMKIAYVHSSPSSHVPLQILDSYAY